MKTIQFTGTEQSETRVYVVKEKGEQYLHSRTDDEFMELAEEQGRVYTLEGFQKAFNFDGAVDTDIDIIRFISVPLFL